jgi:uncharacterized protein (TIGR04255 family)
MNKAEYPKTEDYPPIVDNMSVELLTVPPLRRVFMVTEDDRYVLQLQQDAFIHNWRKIKDTDEYPHFDAARDKFKKKFAEFQNFLTNNELGPVNGTRYEVTYVNHIPGDDMAETLSHYIEVLKIQPANVRKLLPTPRSLNTDLWFNLSDDQGRLRVSIKQGTRPSDKKEVLQVELIARGAAKADFSNMDNWLEVAHEWIVKGFTEITTTEAQKQWERIL